MTIEDLLLEAMTTSGCVVLPSDGVPQVPAPLPSDLAAFYALCGGAALFQGSEYSLSISGPQELVPASQEVIGEWPLGDVSDSWYVIARDDHREVISIDLSPTGRGRCYDSHHEVHGIAGSSPVVASSFTDLLTRVLRSGGTGAWWLREDFEDLGDAYG